MKGKPTKYKPEIGVKICAIIATSNKSVATVCKELGYPVGTVLRWISDNEDMKERYTRAKEAQADYLAEEIIEIADDTSEDVKGIDSYGNPIENREFINRSRLRVDARKWIAAKLKPKKYGDKLDVTTGGKELKPLDLSAIPTSMLEAVLKQNENKEGEA